MTQMELPYKTKIVFLQLGRIGDFILSTALLPIIKRERPDIEIGIITKKALIPIVRCCKHIDVMYNYSINPKIIMSYLRLILSKPNVFVDLNHFISGTSRIASFLSLSEKRLTISTGRKIWPFTDTIYEGEIDKLHIVDRSLIVARYFGLNVLESDRRPHLCIPDCAFSDAEKYIEEIGFSKFIAVNISSGSEDRLLSQDKWIDIFDFILNISDVSILILALPKHREIVNKIIKGGDKISRIKAYTDGDFFLFSSLITKSSLLISPDTSAVHIASAFNVPVIGLYPDVQWNLQSFSPIGEKSIALSEKGNLVKDMNTLRIKEVIRRYIT